MGRIDRYAIALEGTHHAELWLLQSTYETGANRGSNFLPDQSGKDLEAFAKTTKIWAPRFPRKSPGSNGCLILSGRDIENVRSQKIASPNAWLLARLIFSAKVETNSA